MLDETMRSYIANLPIGATRSLVRAQEVDTVSAIDIDNLPNGVVTGSNLIQFPDAASPQLRSSIALSMLAAQRVATNDAVATSPKQWLDRYTMVLSNLNWRIEGGGEVVGTFDKFDVAVHEAILPFLTAAFGGAVVGAALIVTALKQLKEMDKDSSWITLFDRESRRFDVTEYQFSVVEVEGDQTRLKTATARLDASFGKTQVLFFKVKKEKAKFQSAHQTLVGDSGLLEEMNSDLKAKLSSLTKSFIQGLPL